MKTDNPVIELCNFIEYFTVTVDCIEKMRKVTKGEDRNRGFIFSVMAATAWCASHPPINPKTTKKTK